MMPFAELQQARLVQGRSNAMRHAAPSPLLPHRRQVLDAPKLLLSNTIVPFRFNLGDLNLRRPAGAAGAPPTGLSVRIVCMNATMGDNVCAWPAGTSLNANSLGVAVPMFDHAAKSAPVLDVSLVSKEGPNTFFVQVPYLSSVGVESPFINTVASATQLSRRPCRVILVRSMAAAVERTCACCCSLGACDERSSCSAYSPRASFHHRSHASALSRVRRSCCPILEPLPLHRVPALLAVQHSSSPGAREGRGSALAVWTSCRSAVRSPRRRQLSLHTCVRLQASSHSWAAPTLTLHRCCTEGEVPRRRPSMRQWLWPLLAPSSRLLQASLCGGHMRLAAPHPPLLRARRCLQLILSRRLQTLIWSRSLSHCETPSAWPLRASLPEETLARTCNASISGCVNEESELGSRANVCADPRRASL